MSLYSLVKIFMFLFKFNFKFKNKGNKQGQKMVLDHLIKENRPFSAQDIANALTGKLGKTAIVNALDELAKEEKIIEKTYGKQKVYMALQVCSILMQNNKI